MPDLPLRLSEFLPYRLSILSNTISRRIARLYDTEFGLTIWQWRVMAVLGESSGITATAIGQQTAMDKVAVSRAVAGLIELGYLERRTSIEDGRRSELRLTQMGRGIYAEIVPLALQVERELLESLSAEECAELERLLTKLAKIASPDHPLW